MAAAAVMPSSAAGLLTLLDDENDELKHYALVHLNKVVHEFWFQIASYIGSVEALYEDDEFKDRELAALIASKVRQQQQDSVTVLALQMLHAGDLLTFHCPAGVLSSWRAGLCSDVCPRCWGPF
eukprot:GHRQ01039297.1.p1 GENE.GHRQ01039297.1~~GHRQ01039297.1.p1  ORF type:complete len:124 (-),score=25.99 GHRQ01039297.1:124-495(-)